MRSSIKSIAIVVLLVSVLLGGVAIVRYSTINSTPLVRDAQTATGREAETKPIDPGPRYKQYESIFLPLAAEIHSIPTTRKGNGGGLTSMGDAVLLLTYEGRVFTARSAGDIHELPIKVPDNGFASFQRAAKSKRFKHLDFNFVWLRYNDILYYQSQIGHGLVVSYTEYNEPGACYGTAIAVLKLAPEIRTAEQLADVKEPWHVVYRTRPCLPLKSQRSAMEGHLAGGRIAFKAPATIYLASGDYGWDGMHAPKSIAQDPAMAYGKVISIDLDSGESRIITTGNRNMQGIAFDRAGRLWTVEHGLRGGDELNQIVEGANYGWPEETLGTMYSRLPARNTRSYGRHETFTPPVFAWLPSVATSGLTRIEGFHESWDGDLLMSTLRNRSLHRLRIRDDRLLFEERIRIGKRIRYVYQHSDGRIVLWTDDHKLIFLSVPERGPASDLLRSTIAALDHAGDIKQRLRETLETCMECHSFVPGVHEDAPSLASIFDAPIAGTSYSGYSAALKAHGGRWTRTELSAFLKDPTAFAPGTAMPDPGINDPAVLEALVDVLRDLDVRLHK